MSSSQFRIYLALHDLLGACEGALAADFNITDDLRVSTLRSTLAKVQAEIAAAKELERSITPSGEWEELAL